MAPALPADRQKTPAKDEDAGRLSSGQQSCFRAPCRHVLEVEPLPYRHGEKAVVEGGLIFTALSVSH